MKIRMAALVVVAALTAATSATAGNFKRQEVTVGTRKNMEATLFIPDGPGPFPSVLVMHTSFGITEADRGYCANLAREGFICIAPAFLRAHGIMNEEVRRKAFTSEARPIMEDFVEIIGELNALPQAKKGAVGAVGFSNGGFFAAMLAAIGRVRAGVSYYGALDGARTHKDLDVFRSRWQANSSPMLILAGENDTTIGKGPPALLDQIIKGVGARDELKWYPDAGHGFDRNGTTGAGNAAAAADAWPRTLAFLRANGVQ
jgi:carboxymethylenebutenolidase